MTGETDLDSLLAGLEPRLHPDEFVYCTAAEPIGNPIGLFRELEGYTLILPRREAERSGIPYTYPCRMITLTVHSSLEAVGLLALVTTALAERAISVSAVSAYYHDHLFVPVERAEEALAVLRTVRRSRP
jgi:hypothetical protein